MEKVLKLAGVCADEVKNTIHEVPEGLKVEFTAKPGECVIIITADSDEKDQAKELWKPFIKKIKSDFPDQVFSMDAETELEDVVVSALAKKNYIITTAESCTAGLLSGRIVNCGGASQVFEQGFVTYSNKAKRKLIGVRKETLKKYGAVSKQTAKEMAKGAAMTAAADVAIAVTGIAGPDGGTKEKPVGLVYIACFCDGKTVVEEHLFKGNRSQVRQATVACALNLVLRCIL